MFSNAKVGDKVWHHNRQKWSTILRIYKNHTYCIEIEEGLTFTAQGLSYSENKMPSIFLNKWEVPKEAFVKPLPQLDVDTKVIVWDDVNKKKKRHFSHFEDNKIKCFRLGQTSFSNDYKGTTVSWDNWELYKKNKNN